MLVYTVTSTLSIQALIFFTLLVHTVLLSTLLIHTVNFFTLFIHTVTLSPQKAHVPLFMNFFSNLSLDWLSNQNNLMPTVVQIRKAPN